MKRTLQAAFAIAAGAVIGGMGCAVQVEDSSPEQQLHGATNIMCDLDWDTLDKSAEDSSGLAPLVDVRAGQHDCFDRLVFEMDGPETGYFVGYRDRIREDGSGFVVPTLGAAFLEIVLREPAHDVDFNPTFDPKDTPYVGDFRAFRDVTWAGSFEGQTTVGLGVSAKLPFRVFTLEGPGDKSRVVVDVAHNNSGPTLRLETYCYFDPHSETPAKAANNCRDYLGEFGRDWEQTLFLKRWGNRNATLVPQVVPDGLSYHRYSPNDMWWVPEPVLPDGWHVMSECPFLGDTPGTTNGLRHRSEPPFNVDKNLPYIDRTHVVCYEQKTTGYYCPHDPVTRAQMATFLIRMKYGSGYEAPPATGMFADVHPSGTHAANIEQLARDGLTKGCNKTHYCPRKPVTRAQMATFLVRFQYGSDYEPPPATGIFKDVPTHAVHAPFIEQFANDRTTLGCKGGYYCPHDPVKRSQMATFLLRVRHGADYEPPPPTGRFKDVPNDSMHADFIDQLAREGITIGCTR